jgi:hypothetical protein
MILISVHEKALDFVISELKQIAFSLTRCLLEVFTVIWCCIQLDDVQLHLWVFHPFCTFWYGTWVPEVAGIALSLMCLIYLQSHILGVLVLFVFLLESTMLVLWSSISLDWLISQRWEVLKFYAWYSYWISMLADFTLTFTLMGKVCNNASYLSVCDLDWCLLIPWIWIIGDWSVLEALVWYPKHGFSSWIITEALCYSAGLYIIVQITSFIVEGSILFEVHWVFCRQ